MKNTAAFSRSDLLRTGGALDGGICPHVVGKRRSSRQGRYWPQGRYDFTLRWVADQAGSGTDDVPSKTQIDVLVVDHIEKTPTDN
jgi:hypothetical protein